MRPSERNRPAPWDKLSRTRPCLGDALLPLPGALAAAGRSAFSVASVAQGLESRGWYVCSLAGDGPRDEMLARAAEEARAAATQPGLMRPSGISQKNVQNTRVRGDRLIWLKELPTAPVLYKLYMILVKIGMALNGHLKESLGLELLYPTDAMLACYEGGAHYRPHWDADVHRRGDQGRDRRLSTIVYLNPGWRREDGGALRVLDPKEGGWFRVWPELGTVIVFRGDRILHEVQASRARRMALTCWHLGEYKAWQGAAPAG